MNEICNFILVTIIVRVFAGCVVQCRGGSQEVYDGCIMAVHAPDALKILGDQATSDEQRILGAFQYVYRYLLQS